MSTVLTNEEEALYNDLKYVYNRVQNEEHLVGVQVLDYLHSGLDHLKSWSGWIGKYWYFVLPVVLNVGYLIGWYVHRH